MKNYLSIFNKYRTYCVQHDYYDDVLTILLFYSSPSQWICVMPIWSAQCPSELPLYPRSYRVYFFGGYLFYFVKIYWIRTSDMRTKILYRSSLRRQKGNNILWVDIVGAQESGPNLHCVTASTQVFNGCLPALSPWASLLWWLLECPTWLDTPVKSDPLRVNSIWH